MTKINTFNDPVRSPKGVSITRIAKQYKGINGQTLNKLLEEKGVITQDACGYKLTAQYSKEGIATAKAYEEKGVFKRFLVWLPKGVDLIEHLVKDANLDNR